MKSMIIGLGETGQALHDILKTRYGNSVYGYDLDKGEIKRADILHICIPDCQDFINIVNDYVTQVAPICTVVHSSVRVGTTAKIKGMSFHSPIRGKHPNMIEGLKTYTKILTFDDGEYNAAKKVAKYMIEAGIPTQVYPDTKMSELGKLLALSRYGVYIAFAKEQQQICEDYGVDYTKAVALFEKTRTDGLKALDQEHLVQPRLYPFDNYVGGHCTVEDMEIILRDKEYPLLKQAYEIDRNTKIWDNCIIYDTAKIGKGVSIGAGSEIGENVVIEDNVRIGAKCFIPQNVIIRKCAFIAPGVFFSNDKHPPSKKQEWGKIEVQENAIVGMGSIILPGVTVGKGAVIGAGSLVTKSVPNGEMWYGNTAAYSRGVAYANLSD